MLFKTPVFLVLVATLLVPIFANQLNINLLAEQTNTEQSQILNQKKDKIDINDIKLDGTYPNFLDPLNPQITPPMQTAILKALQKWKSFMPMDNTFTVTSWAPIKSDTDELKTKAKKLDADTPNAYVVYMWSQTQNPNYREYSNDIHDYEAGDPRFIRKEFNVLLKQRKNGNWKAVIEKDAELKNEVQEIIETVQDQKTLEDLFGTNQTNNEFTYENLSDETQPAQSLNINDQTTSSHSNNTQDSTLNHFAAQTNEILKNFLGNNQGNSANTSKSKPEDSQQNILEEQNAENQKPADLTLVERLFSLGSVSVSAGEYDYSWPWRAGQTWNVITDRNDGKCPTVQNGWHGCGEYNGLDGNGNPALDLWPQLGNNADFNIYAPVTGTISRVCRDSENLSFRLGSMRILHASNSGFVNEISVRKGQTIARFETKNNGYFSGPCGYSFGVHTHIKFIDNGLMVDGQRIYHYNRYNSFTSNNTGVQSNIPPILVPAVPPTSPPQNPTPPAVPQGYNRYTSKFASLTSSNLVLNVQNNNPNSQTRVNLFANSQSVGQKWSWNPTTKEIKGINDKCLDGGAMWLTAPADRELRISDCHGQTNQQWYADSTGRIKSQYDNSCIDSAFGNQSGSFVYTGVCHNGYNQQWDINSLGMTFNNNSFTQTLSPENDSNFVYNVEGSVTTDGTPVKLQRNTNIDSQKFKFEPSTNEIKGLGNKCLDAGNIADVYNRYIRIFTCHGGSNQKWFMDTKNRIHTLANESLCIDSQSGNAEDSNLYMFSCHNNFNQKWNKNNFTMQIRNWTEPPELLPTDKWFFRRAGTNLCLSANNPQNGKNAQAVTCNSNSIDQKWDAYVKNGFAFVRRTGTTQCLSMAGFSNGTPITTEECNHLAMAHTWSYDFGRKTLTGGGTSQCLARPEPSGSQQVYSWSCNSNDPATKWDASYIGKS